MKKAYSFFVVLGIAAASLSSCSRANYAFNPNTPAYLNSAKAVAAAPAPAVAEATAPATAPEVAPETQVAAVPRAARRPAHRAATSPAAEVAAAVAASAAPAKATLTKAERKTVRQAIRQLAAPQKAAADGKSQTTALILCILLGGIGVHQFYLGYTGRGILRIALALTAFLIIPAIVNLVLYILDIIKIVNGDLKPRDGEYAQKFNN